MDVEPLHGLAWLEVGSPGGPERPQGVLPRGEQPRVEQRVLLRTGERAGKLGVAHQSGGDPPVQGATGVAQWRRQGGGEPGQTTPLGTQLLAVALVAEEELVAALAAQGHGDVAPGEARDLPVGPRRGVPEGLVEDSRQSRERGVEIGRPDPLLDVLGAEVFGDAACGRRLVAVGRLGAECEGPRMVEERDGGRGVDAAGQEDPHRDVRLDVLGDDPGEQLAEPLGRLLGVAQSLGRDRRPVALDPRAAGLPHQRVGGRELENALERRLRRRDELVGEDIGEGRLVDLRRPELEQRLELGGEGQPAANGAVVERLDPEPVAGEEQPAAAAIPECEREHAGERADAGVAVSLQEVEHDLRVGGRDEGTVERATQLEVVVDLAVVAQHQGPKLHRLAARRGQVQDREPRVAELRTFPDPGRRGVRPAVGEASDHPLGGPRGDLVPDHSGDAAHGGVWSRPARGGRPRPAAMFADRIVDVQSRGQAGQG